MATKAQSVPRDSFRFRFSNRKLRDIQLMQWIAEDLELGHINISEIIKDLLYAWYCQRHNGGSGLMPPTLMVAPSTPPEVKPQERLEDPDDPLVRAFSNITFDQFS